MGMKASTRTTWVWTELPDRELLAIARRENSIIITADLDFPRILALSSAEGPGLILFRGGNYSDAEMRDLLDRVLAEVPPEVLEVSVCVVDKQRIRFTRLPLGRRDQ
jgi:predicted nuclease of predicted toxin-antitoxin system